MSRYDEQRYMATRGRGAAWGESSRVYSGTGRVVERPKWKKVDGVYVEPNRGIAIEKKGTRWHWATEGGESGTSKTLKDAKQEAWRRTD